MIRKAILLFITVSFFGRAFAQDEARLLRFPAVHGDQVVFTYAGDLYTVSANGGTARKITSDIGFEMFAKFSPDGKQIAFTGQYDGNTEVYLMPAEGGEPKRITYTATLNRDDVADRMGPNNIVMAWHPNGKEVIYRSRRYSFNSFQGELFSAPVTGDLSKELPFSVAGWCSYSEDGSLLAYNRVFREFRTWKYYRGGMADDVWIYNTKTGTSENITNNEAQDIMPMIHGRKVYFLSDRDRIMNIFSYDLDSKTTEKVTNFDRYDVKFASLGDNAIAFENGGYIYLLDLTTNETKKVKVIINEDGLSSRKDYIDASKYISSYEISPDGKRILYGARGDIYTVPAEHGFTRNLTSSSGAHDRNAVWSPDGKYIAFVSDMSGEDAIYLADPKGESEPKKLTDGYGVYMYDLVWSPDSKKILFADRSQNLYCVNVSNGKKDLIDHSGAWEFRNYKWTPDSRFIVYSFPKKRFSAEIKAHNVETGTKTQLTNGWYGVGSFDFSPDGKYMYLVSSRDFNPIYNNLEWNTAYVNMQKVYIVPIKSDVMSIFDLKNDEVEVVSGPKEEEAAPESTTVIEFADIENRLEPLNIPAGNYFSVQATNEGVYYYYNKTGNGGTAVKFYNIDDQKEETLDDHLQMTLTPDRKKVVLRKSGKFYVEAAGKSKPKYENPVDLSGMKVWIDHHEEWNQIFYESWRQMRDFFYDPNMHGVDWKDIRSKYEVLLPYVQHRNDLSYIIGEMIGELNVGHAYVSGGDRPNPDRIKMGLLGARFKRDASGNYEITSILKGANWSEEWSSPLGNPDLEIKEGMFILAINGRPVAEMANIYEGLIGQAGKTTELTIANNAKGEGKRNILVKPLSDESALYYYEWVEANRKYVDEQSDGQIGYIHIPNMITPGLNMFSRYFYSQLDKKALIIDDRGNGGGNVSPMIIERLRREVAMGTAWRNGEFYGTKPAQTHVGPKVCLIDQYSASDGDLFPYQFRYYKLGPLVGQRSWGGVVGIRGSLPFIDGGGLTKPEFSHFDGKNWVIEGEGVSPDVEVVNDPHQVYLGTDAQLQKAIELMLKELEKGQTEFVIPAFPDKSK